MLKQKWKRLLAFVLTLAIACAALTVSLTVFNVNTSGKAISFTSSDGTSETLEAIGSTYDGNGYFVSTYYDVNGERKYFAKLIGENDTVVFESELTHATIDGETDNGVFSTVIGVSEDRVIAFTGSWYYLYALTENGLELLDVHEGYLSIGASFGTKNYAFDVYDDTIDIYTLDTKGSNAATVSVYVEKTTIVGDKFTGSIYGEIKRVSGKRLMNMGAVAQGIAVTEDHNNVIAVFTTAKAMMFDSDFTALSITDTSEYSEHVKTIQVGGDTTGGATVTAAQYDGNNALYVFLQDRSVYRITEKDFAEYDSEDYAPDLVTQLSEYGSYCAYDEGSDMLFTVNVDGSTVYAIDAEDDDLVYKVSLNFKIRDMVLSEQTGRFVCQWQNSVTDKIELTSYDYEALRFMNTAAVWKTVLMIVAVVALLASVILGVSVFHNGFAASSVKKVKWFFINVWKWKWVYLIMLPSFILLFLFSIYPSVASIFNSFFEYELGKPKVFVGLENYRELFVTNSGLFLEIARNTVLLVAMYLFAQIVPPVFYAYLIMLLRNKNSVKIIRWFLYIPGLLPTIATMLMWRYGIYGINPDGALNIIIRMFGGTPIPFLGDSRYAIWSVLLIGFPWVGGFLLFYGALMTVPTEVYDACELDGCGLFRRFFVIDLPFIMGQVKYVSIGAFIAGVKSVGRIMATTDGQLGTMTLMYKLYDYLNNNQYGMASTIAVIMVILLAGISLARVRKMLKKENAYD